jgi:hypothetical protein
VSTEQDVRRIVEQAILDQPRSQQTLIGPSELGLACDRCLGHKLAGTPIRRTVEWQPYVGTAVHRQLERVFETEAVNGRWTTESKLWVGDIDGIEIWGTSDLFDHDTGTVIDFKTASKTRLAVARLGTPSQQYRAQVHLYGRGWHYNGAEVNAVAIWYVPRDGDLSRSVWWQEPYDERVALDALARAEAFAKAIRILGADQFLPTLQRDPANCYDCNRYPAYPTDPPLHTGAEPLADLIPA